MPILHIKDFYTGSSQWHIPHIMEKKDEIVRETLEFRPQQSRMPAR